MLKRLTVCSLLALLLYADSDSKGGCPIRPPLPDVSSQRTYTNEYENTSYGYSVVIPHGLTGVDTDNPAYQKGFTIVLRSPERTISVFADTNSLDYSDPKAAAAGELALFKQQQGMRFKDEQIVPTDLSTHVAAKLLFHYRCSDQDVEYTHVEIIAMSSDGQYIYTIAWDGAATAEKSDERLISALKRSWRFSRAK
jgi:hypothetical protein